MTHSALVDAVLFWLVVFMTLLLVMFLFAVITTPPEDAVRAEAPVLKPPAPAPAAQPPTLPVRQPQAPTAPAGTVGQPTGAGHAARHATAAATVNLPAEGPRRGRRRGAPGPADRRPDHGRDRRMAVPPHTAGRYALLAPGRRGLLARVRRAYCHPAPRRRHRLAGIALVFTALFLALR